MIPNITLEFIIDRIKNTAHPSFMETPFEEFKGPVRRAAVLVPLVLVENEWHLLFTRRTDFVDHHKGQVSFPGGRVDPDDDSPEATALRETFEEIGVRPEDVQVVGALGEYLTVSNYLVTPVIGIISWPRTFTVHTPEVERVFTIPLDWLADISHRQEMVRKETDRSLIVYLPFDGELLWGVTARITVNFLSALGLSQAHN
jgi:8-oxo-dGTP pyrophosphatase MutT (NUDIX family)